MFFFVIIEKIIIWFLKSDCSSFLRDPETIVIFAILESHDKVFLTKLPSKNQKIQVQHMFTP